MIQNIQSRIRFNSFPGNIDKLVRNLCKNGIDGEKSVKYKPRQSGTQGTSEKHQLIVHFQKW